jgi:hypothetical protein
VPFHTPLTVGIDIVGAEGGVTSHRAPNTTFSRSPTASVSCTKLETVSVGPPERGICETVIGIGALSISPSNELAAPRMLSMAVSRAGSRRMASTPPRNWCRPRCRPTV